jgi:hypothetical protein
MRWRSVWNRLADLLISESECRVNVFDLADDIPKIGTAREAAVQFRNMLVYFLSA